MESNLCKTLNLKTFKKSFFFFVIFLLTACSEFYGYQPPAPVFSQSQGTNPYENNRDSDRQATKNNVIRIQPIVDNHQEKPVFHPIKPDIPTSQVNKVKPMSPAVVALLAEADGNSRAGDHDSAVSTIERALRIDSRNPTLTYKLAVLRLKQSKPRLAEDLAKKAALLSGKDRVLKRKCWLLISEARKRQNNLYGAKEAKIKANNL